MPDCNGQLYLWLGSGQYPADHTCPVPDGIDFIAD
jgi:hypothetical protein